MLKYQNMLKTGGMLFLNGDLISEQPSRTDIRVIRVPANSLAREMGNDKVLNMVMLGAVTRIGRIVSEKAVAKAIETVLEGKRKSLIQANQKAISTGAEYASREI